MCCNDIHPLLLECLITFPRYIRMSGIVSDSTYRACHGQHNVNTNNNTSQLSCKMAAFCHPLCSENGMMCCKERHILLLECFIVFPRRIRMVRGASGSTYKHLMVHNVSLLTKTTTTFHAKYHISDTLSAHAIWGCATMRDIHCCPSISISSICLEGWSNELPRDYTTPIWSTWCYFSEK